MDLVLLGDVDHDVDGAFSLDQQDAVVRERDVRRGPDGRLDFQPLLTRWRVADGSQILQKLQDILVLLKKSNSVKTDHSYERFTIVFT